MTLQSEWKYCEVVRALEVRHNIIMIVIMEHFIAQQQLESIFVCS